MTPQEIETFIRHAKETGQQRADRLLREYQARERVIDEQFRRLCGVTATVNPFPAFGAAKASDMARVAAPVNVGPLRKCTYPNCPYEGDCDCDGTQMPDDEDES